MDYVEDYTLEERLGTAGRQQTQNKKIPQDISSPSGNNGEEKELHFMLLSYKMRVLDSAKMMLTLLSGVR